MDKYICNIEWLILDPWQLLGAGLIQVKVTYQKSDDAS